MGEYIFKVIDEHFSAVDIQLLGNSADQGRSCRTGFGCQKGKKDL